MSFELLDTAELLLSRAVGVTSSDACRASSTVYYAMFHCLAKVCCDLFVGSQTKYPPQRAWQHLFRSLSHSVINERCGKIEKMKSKGFPPAVWRFAELFRLMQWKRERLDYSYAFSPDSLAVRNDVALARGCMDALLATDEMHLRAFAVYVLFGEDRHEKKLIPL